jgi:hypothetical protein
MPVISSACDLHPNPHRSDSKVIWLRPDLYPTLCGAKPKVEVPG